MYTVLFNIILVPNCVEYWGEEPIQLLNVFALFYFIYISKFYRGVRDNKYFINERKYLS